MEPVSLNFTTPLPIFQKINDTITTLFLKCHTDDYLPLNTTLANHQAMLYLNSSRIDEALEVLSKAPQSYEVLDLTGIAHLHKGQQWLQQGETQKAILSYQISLNYLPNNPPTLIHLGHAYLASNEDELALQKFEEALNCDTNYPLAWAGKGAIYLKMEQWDNALASFDNCTEGQEWIAPLKAIALKEKGLSEYLESNYAQAITTLNSAIELDARDPIAYTLLGFANLCMNNQKAAISFFNQALTIDDKLPFALGGLGMVYLSEGQVEQAIEYLNSAYKINPSLEFVKENLGKAYAQIGQEMGDCGKALEFFSYSIHLRPDDILTLSSLGLLHYRNKELNTALTYFQKVLEKEPSHWLSLTYQGSIYIEQKLFTQAIKSLEKAKNANPNHPFVIKTWNHAYHRLCVHLHAL